MPQGTIQRSTELCQEAEWEGKTMSWDVYCSFHRKEQNRVSRLKIGWLDYFQQVLGLAAISGGSDGKKNLPAVQKTWV